MYCIVPSLLEPGLLQRANQGSGRLVFKLIIEIDATERTVIHPEPLFGNADEPSKIPRTFRAPQQSRRDEACKDDRANKRHGDIDIFRQPQIRQYQDHYNDAKNRQNGRRSLLPSQVFTDCHRAG
jgi:hypothetical protein